MQVFDYSDFTQNITKVFNTALVDEVIINYNDGNSYKLLPIDNENIKGKSPLEDIPSIKADITTQEIVEILRECRAGI
ncbi:hypothetical protein FACS189485_16980 [Spirochaetia bacterium]|nr:hypothetical protein FACS1894106_5890 [Spirochaetia bacterium]GHV07151.1 hypothetical protein FACS189485_16980 [Spirochaetia bacterium]